MKKIRPWASAHPVLSVGVGFFLVYVLAASLGAGFGHLTGLQHHPTDWGVVFIAATALGFAWAFIVAMYNVIRGCG